MVRKDLILLRHAGLSPDFFTARHSRNQSISGLLCRIAEKDTCGFLCRTFSFPDRSARW
jgi:hypothetical protein